MNIASLDALRALYTTPGERAVQKQLSSLDRHCRRFIEPPRRTLWTSSR